MKRTTAASELRACERRLVWVFEWHVDTYDQKQWSWCGNGREHAQVDLDMKLEYNRMYLVLALAYHQRREHCADANTEGCRGCACEQRANEHETNRARGPLGVTRLPHVANLFFAPVVQDVVSDGDNQKREHHERNNHSNADPKLRAARLNTDETLWLATNEQRVRDICEHQTKDDKNDAEGNFSFTLLNLVYLGVVLEQLNDICVTRVKLK